jgi:hypothetical protein
LQIARPPGTNLLSAIPAPGAAAAPEYFFTLGIKGLEQPRAVGVVCAFIPGMNRFFTSTRAEEKLVFCVASSRSQAEAVMHRLESEKFPVEHISVVFPNQGALNLPGIGAYIAAGPLLVSLRDATRDSTAGIAAGLAGLGVAELAARRCQSGLEAGNFLLSLHAATGEDIERAERIFSEMGARDICHAEGRPQPERGVGRVHSGLLGWSLPITG